MWQRSGGPAKQPAAHPRNSQWKGREREGTRALLRPADLFYKLQPTLFFTTGLFLILSLSFFLFSSGPSSLSVAFLLYIFNCDITDFLWCRCPLAAQHRYRIGWTTQWQVRPTCWSADKLGGHWICDCSTSSVADLLFVILRNVCPVIIMSFIFLFSCICTQKRVYL